MTMPALIGNYKKKVLVNQLKKCVSIFEQGMQKIYVSEGAVSWDELGWGKSNSSILNHNTPFLFQKFKENFNIINYKMDTEREDFNYIKKMDSQDSVTDIGSGGFFVFGFTMRLADGSIWYYRGVADSDANNFVVIVDVNGDRGPNQAGRDIFQLVYTGEGRLVGLFSKDYLKSLNPDLTDEEIQNFMSMLNLRCEKNGQISASGICFEKIREDGWEMKY